MLKNGKQKRAEIPNWTCVMCSGRRLSPPTTSPAVPFHLSPVSVSLLRSLMNPSSSPDTCRYRYLTSIYQIITTTIDAYLHVTIHQLLLSNVNHSLLIQRIS